MLTRKQQWEEHNQQTVQVFQHLGPYRSASYMKVDPHVVNWVVRQLMFWTTLTPQEQAKLRALGIDQKEAPILQSKRWEPFYQRPYHLLCDTEEDRKAYTDPGWKKTKNWIRIQVFGSGRLSREQQKKLQPLVERVPELNLKLKPRRRRKEKGGRPELSDLWFRRELRKNLSHLLGVGGFSQLGRLNPLTAEQNINRGGNAFIAP